VSRDGEGGFREAATNGNAMPKGWQPDKMGRLRRDQKGQKRNLRTNYIEKQ
jgi:hypothetical protein